MWSTSGPLKQSPSEGRRSRSDRAARSLHSSQSMCGEGQFGARRAQPLNSKLDLRSRALPQSDIHCQRVPAPGVLAGDPGTADGVDSVMT